MGSEHPHRTGGSPDAQSAARQDAGQPPPMWADAAWDFRLPLLVVPLTALVAGYADGYALLRYGVFLANQSGNVVHIGMGLAGRFGPWPASLAAVAGFGVGVILFTRARRSARPGKLSPPLRGLVLAAGLLTVWGLADVTLDPDTRLGAASTLLAGLGSVPLGVLAILFVQVAGIATVTVYQTGTVVHTAEALADFLPGSRKGTMRARAAVLLGVLSLGGYGLGGALGAHTDGRSGWFIVCAVPVVLVQVLLLRSVRVPEPTDGARHDPGRR